MDGWRVVESMASPFVALHSMRYSNSKLCFSVTRPDIDEETAVGALGGLAVTVLVQATRRTSLHPVMIASTGISGLSRQFSSATHAHIVAPFRYLLNLVGLDHSKSLSRC
jgi:hypothetical protein